MYVNVHVTVHDLEKLMDVFRSALVKEYHKETGILFENNVLKMKLYFEKTPPQETIYSFCECGNVTYLEYNYSGNENYDNSKQEDSSKEEIKSEPTSDEKEEKLAKKSDEGGSNNSPLNTPTTSKGKKYVAKEKAINIPKFEEIAKTTNSKSDFLNGVISFLEVPSDLQAAFLQIIEIYPELEKITWENILAALEKKEVAFNSYNRRVICDCVTKKLNLRFINVIASINRILSEHKGNSPAGVENTNDSEKEGEEKNSKNPVSDNEKQEITREVLLNCMPKLSESTHIQDIDAIEDVLKTLKEDTESSFNVKIVKVVMILTGKCMPNAYMKEELNQLISFTTNAVETLQNEVHCYLKPETITEDKVEQNFFRMQILKLSTIANNLAKLYNPNFDGRITAKDFLSDLKDFLQ